MTIFDDDLHRRIALTGGVRGIPVLDLWRQVGGTAPRLLDALARLAEHRSVTVRRDAGQTWVSARWPDETTAFLLPARLALVQLSDAERPVAHLSLDGDHALLRRGDKVQDVAGRDAPAVILRLVAERTAAAIAQVEQRAIDGGRPVLALAFAVGAPADTRSVLLAVRERGHRTWASRTPAGPTDPSVVEHVLSGGDRITSTITALVGRCRVLLQTWCRYSEGEDRT